MVAPVFQTPDYRTAWNSSTTPKNTTTDPSVVPGTLCVLGGSEDSTATLGTPSGGGLTYTLRQSIVVSSRCTAYGWTAPVVGSSTFALQCTRGGSALWWGAMALMFSGSDGVGASGAANAASGGPSLTFTTLHDNSAIAMIVTDWSATDGASRAYRTPSGSSVFTELMYFRDVDHYGAYLGYYADAGVAGSKTIGLTTPSMAFSVVGIEIRGTTAAAVSRPPILHDRLPMGALLQL